MKPAILANTLSFSSVTQEKLRYLHFLNLRLPFNLLNN
ncbi:hypothetical protein SAMN06265350_10859 [Solitalea koreensis]|uniref:Uncharacterized protein n=1 Tax=Solitalea koreensis TaxID=543615 RepID=A0A521DRX9_9SPHI|nr:hypothetical protein SAMN06265350_10859 [Solitalea koreensis]